MSQQLHSKGDETQQIDCIQTLYLNSKFFTKIKQWNNDRFVGLVMMQQVNRFYELSLDFFVFLVE
jgi:hypothetical protein